LQHFGPRHILAREVIREVAGYSGYEMRVLEFLRNGLDKKALRLAKRKVRFSFASFQSSIPAPTGLPIAFNTPNHLRSLTVRINFFIQIGTHVRGKKKREELTRVLATQNLAKAKLAAEHKKQH